MTDKYLVTWDFSRKPSVTFYRVLRDEFGSSHPAGDYELIQRSVAICRDDFIASRLVALAEHFGAKVGCFQVARNALAGDVQNEACEFVERVLARRVQSRGNRRGRRGRMRCRE